MSAAKRRRRQHVNGFAHLARICGKHVRGGRPIYKRRSLVSVAEAIARERLYATREARMKQRKK